MAEPPVIRIASGPKANLPTLAVREPAFTSDTFEFFIGTAAGNKMVGAAMVIVRSADFTAGRVPFATAAGILGDDAGLAWNNGTKTLTATNIAGAFTGNAATATKLATARAINGVNFDGTAPITIGVTEATITLADNTTNDVSTARHGLVPKAPNDTAKFLRGDGTWAAAGGALADFAAGANIVWSYDGQIAAQRTTYTKVFERRSAIRGGTVTVEFTLYSIGSYYVYGRIYVNGVAVGTARSAYNTGGSFSENIAINKGDLIQIYAYTTFTSVNIGYRIQSMRVKASEQVPESDALMNMPGA